MRPALVMIAIAACGAPDEPELATATSALTTNGSFEDDFDGWTLAEDSSNVAFGIFGIATTGQLFEGGELAFDFHDAVDVAYGGVALPRTYVATEGSKLAYQVQPNGPPADGTHRMHQDVAITAGCGAVLRWDMEYSSTAPFEASSQFTSVNLRDAATDALLATPFKTEDDAPLQIPMTAFEVDISAFDGQTVRIDFHHEVNLGPFDVAWDNIRVACLTGGAVFAVAPTSHDFGTQRVGVTSAGKIFTISNTGTEPLDVVGTSTTGPFQVAATNVTIPPSGSANVAVTFTPTATGAASGTLEIEHSAPGSPSTIPLGGTGIAPRIATDVGDVDFGDQRVGTTSAPRTVTIENTGSDTLTVSALSTTIEFAATATLPIVLDPSETANVSLTYSPALSGTAIGSLAFTSDATNEVAVDLAGVGVEPIVTVAPTLDFGEVRVGTLATEELVVTNDGSSDLAITGVMLTGDFSNADTFPIVISPGNSGTLTIGFTPSATGTANATLLIASNAATSPDSVALTGIGVQPVASIDTTPVDFGLQRVGLTSPPRQVVVQNTGTFPLTVSAVTVAAPFATLPDPFTVEPGGVGIIDVTFTPAAEGAVNQDLTITHDAGNPVVVPLLGIGTVAELEVAPGTLAYGEIRVGTSSAPQTVTVRNLGLAPLAIESVTTPADFTMSDVTLPRTVLPNASLTFTIAFEPTTDGVVAAAIDIATSAGAASLPVSATAVTAALTSDRATLELGAVQLGEASEVQIVTLTNITAAPISVAGAASSDPQFVLDPPPSTAPVPPGGSVAFGVRFVPSIVGAAAAQLDVTLADESAVEVSLQVSGNGIDDGGGCCSTGGSSSSLLLALAVLGLLRRRR